MLPSSRACRTALVLAALAGPALGCGGAGPYGHAPKYVPTDDEERASKGARDYDPVMAEREPEVWQKSPVTLFGIVTARAAGPGGTAYVGVSVRRLEPRNLCANANDDDTCRVTVSDRDFGVVHAVLALRPEDDLGERSLGAGSLVRLVGRLGQDVDATDGNPILRTTFYRHWPRSTYATKANAETLRQ